jgi:hypothetical protein
MHVYIKQTTVQETEWGEKQELINNMNLRAIKHADLGHSSTRLLARFPLHFCCNLISLDPSWKKLREIIIRVVTSRKSNFGLRRDALPPHIIPPPPTFYIPPSVRCSKIRTRAPAALPSPVFISDTVFKIAKTVTRILLHNFSSNYLSNTFPLLNFVNCSKKKRIWVLRKCTRLDTKTIQEPTEECSAKLACVVNKIR